MVIGSGLAGQFGMVAEVTYGTPVVVTRFLEFNNESFKADLAHIESRGIGTGRFLKPSRHKSYIKGAMGSIEFDVMTKGFGLPLKMALGQDTPTVVSASSEYLHTIIPESGALTGLMFTAQVGRPDVGGTARAFTYEGGKVTDWEIKAELDGYLKLVLGCDFETVQTGTALATASFATGAEPFDFSEGAVTIGGVTVKVRSFSLKGTNALKTDRRYVGNTKAQPIANGEFTVTGSLAFELEDLTRYAALVAGTEAADLVITFTSPTAIPSGVGAFKIIISLKAFFYTDGMPNIGGPDVIPEVLQFKALDNGTNPVVQILYSTTDTTA